MLRAFLPAVLALTLTAGSALAEARIRVSASILPIHSLVAAVMEGVAEPDLILPPGASPHGYALRPSGAVALSRADVIFRVGPELETFLNRPLANLSGKATVVDLIKAPGLLLLPVRDNDAFEPHEHEHKHEHEHEHEHEKHGHDDHEGHADHEEHADHDRHEGHEGHDAHEGGTDPHVWLDPRNAIAIVRHVAHVLIDTDPTGADLYRTNADRTVERLKALEVDMAGRLAAVADHPFVVFHDAYQYFENRFGLTAAGSIAINPEIAPGARQISLIRSRIAQQHIYCVLAEPQFNSAIIEALASDGHVRVGVIDPVGTTTRSASDGFFGMMDRMATGMVACLGNPG